MIFFKALKKRVFVDSIICYKWTLLSILMLSILCFDIGHIKFFDILTNIASIFLIILLVSKVKFLNVFVVFLISLMLGLEITFFIYYGERVSILILAAAIDESSRYSSSAPPDFLIFSFIITAVVFCFLYLSLRELKKLKLVKYACLCLVILVFICFHTLSLIYNTYLYDFDERSKADFWVSPLLKITDSLHASYPLLIGDNLYVIAHLNELVRINRNSKHDDVLPGIELAREKRDIPLKIVLLLGETSLRTHYSLYGYRFPTTPKLDRLYSNKELIKVDDVISPAPITRESLRLTLSFDTLFNKENFYRYKNIVELAEMLGYKTYWLSTAIESGINGTYVGMVQKSADVSRDPLNDDLLKTEQDKVLLQKFNEFYKDGEKQFFVIHILGSHAPYGFNINRDDPDIKVFETTEKNTSYDKTILHTDKFIAGLIDIIKAHDENTILYYFSDHGEVIGFGHGMMNGGAVQYEIPLIIFQNNNTLPIKEIVEKYRSSNGILNNVNSHYILSELMGLSVDDKLVEQGRKEGKYIYHADGKVYLYEDFLHNKFRQKFHAE